MSAEQAAKAAIARLAAEAKSLPENTTMTNAQKAEKLDAIEAELKDHSDTVSLAAKARRLAVGGEGNVEAAVAAAEGDAPRGYQGNKSLGAQMIESKSWKDISERHAAGLSFHGAIEAKAILDGSFVPGGNATSYDGSAGPVIVPQLVPGIFGINQRPLVVEDLIPAGTTNSPAVWYVIESSWTNAADAVAEGGTKPAMNDVLQRVQEPVSKVAQLYKVSDEMISDAQQYKSFLDARLVLGLRLKVQQQLLNGSGTLPQLRGLNNRSGFNTTVVSGSLAASNRAWFTAILDQVTAIRTTGFVEPNAVLVNPLDWATLQKATDTNGQYYNGGPFMRQYGNNAPNVTSIWGIPLVATLEQPQGSALVGNFADAQVWNRAGVVVETSNSDGTDFQNDIVTVRGERRLGLAVYRPLSFGKVTLTA